MTVTIYTFEDAGGREWIYATQDLHEAHEHTRKYCLKLIANDYEYADSELVADYTDALEGDDGGAEEEGEAT